jgi:threonylcarbamoyladenosine tRNA methylthiotransferase CDKAL1
MRFYIETYGCTANFGDSKDFETALIQKGHRSSPPEGADVLIVNTCAVTEKTERKMLRRLSQLQGDHLIIAGCLPAALPESLSGIRCRRRVGILSKVCADEVVSPFREISDSRTTNAILNSTRSDLCGIVNIAEGCKGACSYCVVRKARGELNSKEPDEIVKSVRKLIRSGKVEIQLAAQDTAAYGMDIGTNLPELLELICELPGSFKVRVGMMNPDSVQSILKELIGAYANQKLYKFLHLPVQSGSDQVLEKMGRKYSASDFIEILKHFREGYSNLFFATDIITGFPGETVKDFDETMLAIRTLQPDKVNITKFSCRPGTLAAKMYDMPDRIKKQRSRELTKLWLEIADGRNHQYLGQVLEVMVTERGKGDSMKARSANYVGVVVQGMPDLGSRLKTMIYGANPFYLKGIMCS